MTTPGNDPKAERKLPKWETISVAGLLSHSLLASGKSKGGMEGRRLGDYALYEELGRGGMGVVYRAEHRKLRRAAAVKLLLAGEFAKPAFAQRFRQEAQLLARLRHPHVVTVYDVGEDDGMAYYAMELVEGQSLDVVEGPPGLVDWKGCAAFLALVARAVEHAHEQGILHRDLKPSNVFRTKEGEPRVMDFGLARWMIPEDASTGGLTLSHEVLGSPSYMSPEQARGENEKVSRPADVYSLGGILYFMLTGRPPFRAASLAQLLAQVTEHVPPGPRVLDPSLPADLETIALKCLEKEPGKRYRTAKELAEELERYARGEMILARPLGPVQRAWRWACRKPAWAAMLGGFITAMTLGIVGTSWQWRRAVAAYHGQLQARAAEAHSRADMERNGYAADVRAASLAILEHEQPEVGRRLLERHRGYAERGVEWGLLWQAARSRELGRIAPAHELAVTELSIVADADLLISGDQLGWVRFWGLKDRAVGALAPLKLEGGVTAILPLAGRRAFLTSASGGTVTEWDASAPPAAVARRTWPGKIATLSADGRTLATSEGDFQHWLRGMGEVRVWSPREAPEPWVLPEKGQWITLSRDGALLAVAGESDGISLWDVAARKKLPQKLGSSTRLWRPEFSPDGKYLAACGHGSAWTWRVPELAAATSAASPSVIPGHGLMHPLDVWAARFHGDRLVTACADRVLRGWDHAQAGVMRPQFTLAGSPEEIWSLAIDPRTGHMVTGVKSGSIHCWPSEAQAQPVQWPVPSYPAPVTSNNGEWAIFPGGGEFPPSLRKVDAHGESHALTLPAFLRPIGFAEGHGPRAPAGLWSLMGDPAMLQKLSLPDLQTQQPPYALASEWCVDGGVSCDGSHAYAISKNNLALVIQLADGHIALRQVIPELRLNKASLSPSGRYLAIAEEKGTQSLHVWDVAAGTRRQFLGHVYSVNDVAFSPDETSLATVSPDAQLKIWSLASGKVTYSVAAHLVQAQGVAWSPDGRTIATISPGEGIKLWHVSTGRELVWWPLPQAFNSVTFSGDGKWLIAGMFAQDASKPAYQQLLPVKELME